MPPSGRQSLLADGTRDESPLAKYVSAELHADGAGVFSMSIFDLLEQQDTSLSGTDQRHRRLHDEGLVLAVMSGLLYLARHARDRAAAGGDALIHAQIHPVTPERPVGLGHNRHYGLPDALGARVLTEAPPAAEAVAGLDDLAQPGPELAAATALLINEIGQAFGVAEMFQITRDGEFRRRYWADQQVITWAGQNGIGVTDNIVG